MNKRFYDSPLKRLLVSAITITIFLMATPLPLRAEEGKLIGVGQEREAANLSHYLAARGFVDSLTKYFEDLVAGEKEIIVVHHSSEFQIDWIVWMIKIDSNHLFGVFDPSKKNEIIKGFSSRVDRSKISIQGEVPSQGQIRDKLKELRTKEIKDDKIVVLMGFNNHAIEENSFSTKQEKSQDALVELLPKESILNRLLNSGAGP